MSGHMCKRGVWLSVDYQCWADAVLELTDLRDE